ncbi:MAG: PAS-domain containing protein [Arenibacterium sp.]
MPSERETREFTTAGLNLIAQALSIYDRELRLAVSNLPFKKMFDLPDALVTPGARFDDTIRYLVESGEYGSIDDVDAFVDIRVQQALAFEPHYMERTRSNGQTISVEGSPLPQGGWVTVYTDISRTKTSEALLRARSAELSDQLLAHTEELSAANRKLAATITALEETKRELTDIEARTRLTTEMMPAHIAHVDPSGRYTYSNRRLSSVLPGCRSDIYGLPIADVLGPATFTQIEPHLKAAYNGRNAVFEFTEPHDSRRIRAAFTPDEAGGVYILSMDVTEETQARVALQQTRRRAVAAQITNGLAHDFSNLLTIILGTQGKLARMGLGQEADALITATRTAAQRGGRLLNQLADMTGNRTLSPAPSDIHSLLQDLKTLATPSLPREVGFSILDHMPEGLLMLDAAMLQDALLNLILNARDACGSSGQIVLSAHVIGNTWIELNVSDTGPGFSEEALTQAVQPFFTTKGGEGSGLGLSMVYDMTKLAGGDLRLANTPNGGSVSLRLPYRPARAVESGLALLVEDSDTLRSLFRDMLIALGYAVIEAPSADEAAALIEDLPDIALILSDIQLQGEKTGLDLMDQVGGANRAMVLMTSLPPQDPLFVAAQARVPVLRKPFAREDLAALLLKKAAE